MLSLSDLRCATAPHYRWPSSKPPPHGPKPPRPGEPTERVFAVPLRPLASGRADSFALFFEPGRHSSSHCGRRAPVLQMFSQPTRAHEREERDV